MLTNNLVVPKTAYKCGSRQTQYNAPICGVWLFTVEYLYPHCKTAQGANIRVHWSDCAQHLKSSVDDHDVMIGRGMDEKRNWRLLFTILGMLS